MKLFEMEPKIDKLGLKKLDARLQRGGRVHRFICSNHGKLVVFDTNGLAYVPIYRLDFDSEAIIKVEIDEINTQFNKLVYINGLPTVNAPELNLVNI
mgnify:FL=1